MQFVITCFEIAELHFAGFMAFACRAQLAFRSRWHAQASHGKQSSDNLSGEAQVSSSPPCGMQFKEAGAIVVIGMSLHLQPPCSNSGVDKDKRGTGWG